VRSISKAKRTNTPASDELGEAVAAYAEALRSHNWIDFDDLIALTVRALENRVAALYHDRFSFVSIDEFQDLDDQQYRLLSLVAPPPRANLCVIGDANQAIYGFRGADSSCFERFKRDYGPAVVNLRRNYRSTGTIVTASAQVIAGGEDEPMAAILRDMQERIAIHVVPTERAEAEFVIQSLEGLIGGHTFFSIDSGRATGAARNLSFADVAVLYRTEAQSMPLSEAFARSGIPFKTSSHAGLAGDPAVAALLQHLDEPTLQPVADQLRAAAERAEHESEHLDRVAIQTALHRLLSLAPAYGVDRRSFLDAVALASQADVFDRSADRVSLLTLHAAKGLEFSVVFIVGLEDSVLPLHWGEPDEATIAEERRLFYVGMTRAKDRLILSRALSRQWRGRVRQLGPSPFLSRIEDELVKHQRSEGLRRKPEDRQLKLL
jgi:DNA helicase-2/ATP-dependent DNA helicase PcrA